MEASEARPDNTGVFEWGPCCACEQEDGRVRNVLFLPKKGLVPGSGWGCLTCRLPTDGALAVLCDACLAQKKPIRFAVSSRADKKGRVPIEELQGEYKHNLLLHGELRRN